MDRTDDARRTGGAFRAGLRNELPLWRAEGLVDERVEKLLVERYRLDEKAADLTAAAIYTLGALLVGGGVISFVAWNWSRIPDGAKLALAASAMAASHIGGYRLWRVTGTWPRAGHALVLVGTLLYGANLGLVAQIYNAHSNWYMGFGAWALGAAVAGWTLRSVPNAALGVVLAAVWGAALAADRESVGVVAPFVIAAVFLPLAWTQRSRLLFGLTVMAVGVTLGVVAEEETSRGCAVAAIELALAATLLAWPSAFRPGSAGAHLAPAARALGLATFGVIAYAASFHESARELSFDRLDEKDVRWAVVAGVLLAAATALLTAGALRSRGPEETSSLRSRAPTLAALAGVALLLAGMCAERESLALAVAANAALAIPAILGLVAAMRDLERFTFWLSTLTLGLLVVSRFFEFDTNLGVKAAAFVGAGVGVILVGVAFERRLRAGRST